jgi:AraC-like DNA-binding protein
VRYRELPPPSVLQPFVRCFWVLEDAGGAGATERVLPDGCVEVILHYGSPMAREDGTGGVEEQPHAIVAGQLRSATRLVSTGSLGMIGVRFEPWAAGPFLRESLSSLTGRIVPLEAFWGAEAGELTERIAEAADDEARVAILTERLLARLLPPDENGRALGAALGWIAESRGAIAVEEIARRLSWSRRRLERRFAEAVGLPPKSLCRIERFQHVVASLADDARPRLVDLAIDAGYSDQAHLAREFRELAGIPVTRYLEEQHPLSDALTGGAPPEGRTEPEET